MGGPNNKPVTVEERNMTFNMAVNLYREGGSLTMTRSRLAEASGLSPGVISKHFGTVKELAGKVIEHGAAARDMGIIAWGLSERHPAARALPMDLKREAIKELLK